MEQQKNVCAIKNSQMPRYKEFRNDKTWSRARVSCTEEKRSFKGEQ